jgi:hypothetical protein
VEEAVEEKRGAGEVLAQEAADAPPITANLGTTGRRGPWSQWAMAHRAHNEHCGSSPPQHAAV